MAFTVQELENITNAALDFHFQKGKVFSQSIQNKPLLREMMSRLKEFPGGKENITVRVKFDYTTEIMGYSHDDTVTYANPANIKTATYPWKEIHWGISVSHTELKKDGISVTDSTTGASTSKHSEREMTVLANILDDKIEDMKEGGERGMNSMFWLDGSQDAKQVPGIQSFILDDPTSAVTVGGIDQSLHAKWRNRASLSITHTTASDQILVQTLQGELRQLRRYGNPKHIVLAGSDMLDWFEKELRSKGNYTLEGWSKSGRIDASVADLAFKGLPIEYDPTLDDMSMADRMYVIDTNAIMPMVMDGENMKKHNPARPEDKYVLYRAMTWTGGLICKQRNTSAVYKLS